MSHYDDPAQLFSALISHLHEGVADLALVNHAMSSATVVHTTVAGDCSYTIHPEKCVFLKVRTGDTVAVNVGEQASGHFSVECDAWEACNALLIPSETCTIELLQTKGVILPKRMIFDESELDALFGEEVLVCEI